MDSIKEDGRITFDARFQHPFNMSITGPTRAGNSTFVWDLLVENADLLDTKYDYINIFTGTKKNLIVSSIRDHYGEHVVHTFEDMKGFFNDDYKKMQQDFPDIFHRMMLRGRELAIF